jgi:RHS repeat-associated protein
VGKMYLSLASCLIALIATMGPAPAQTISGATVQYRQTSLTLPGLGLPAGNLVYIYGFGTGGLYTSSNFAQGAQAGLSDAAGILNAGLAVSTSNSDSFTTSADYYTIGGVAVSGFTNRTESFGQNNAAGAHVASDSFALTQSSLVVVVAIAGGQSSLTVSGLPGLQIDSEVSNPNGGVIAMAVAHANLAAGNYTVTENSNPSPAPGQDPAHQTDLIGVFIFTGPNPSTLGPCTTANLCATSSDPVSTGNGNYFYHHADLAVPGRGMPFLFQRAYNSLDGYSGPLGANWTHSYNVVLTDISSAVIVKWGDGHQEDYTLSGPIYIPPAGVHNTLVKNGDGTYTLTQKNQTQYNFTSAGKLATIVDRNGNTISLTYDGNGNLTQIADTVGRVFTLGYDASNRIVKLADPTGRQVLYSYSASNDLETATDPTGAVTTFAYDGSHHVTQVTLPNGATLLKDTYDAAGRVISQTNGDGFTTTFAYDTPGTNQTTITGPLGNTTVHRYDSSLRITAILDVLGGTVSYTYDADNNRTSVTNQNGKTTTFAYDAQGNVTGATDPFGKTTAFQYDAKNDLTQITDRLGRVTTFVYDAKGNLMGITDAAGGASTFTYDPAGEVLGMKNARGFTTTLSYDSFGDLTKATDALGGTVEMAYDGVGRLLQLKNQLGNTWSRTYDADDRLLGVADPLGDSTQFAYDPNGNLIRITDANGNVTRYAYDAMGKLTQVTDAIGGITRYTYDPNRNLASAIDANGHTTTYTYDALSRPIMVTDPLGRKKRYNYDGVGNITGVVDGNSKTNTFAYDALNRLTLMSLSDGKSVAYSYDAVGNRLSMTDWRGGTTYAYDALNRVLAVASPDGKAVGYTYDSVGNRAGLTYPNGNPVQYQYDALNRLVTAADWNGKATLYTYDAAGNLTGMAQPNGASSAYTYDAANRLLRLENATSPGNSSPVSARSAFAYTLDRVGNRTSVTSLSGEVTRYGYDALYRLTSWMQPSGQITQYSYDAAGNRRSMSSSSGTTSYTYDAADQLLTAGATTFAYDGNGSRVQRIADGTTTSYAWDALNRLASVTGGGRNSQFAYDGDGNRVSQQIAAGTYQYLNDTATALPVVLNESGPDGNIAYAYGRSVISESVSPSQFFYQFDGLGSVVNVTNDAGAMNANYGYDPWGEAIRPSDPPIGLDALGTKNKYRFTGEALDPGTGLYYLRARFYDPGVGRFLSADPFPGIATFPLSLNKGVYAGDSPITMTDPRGELFGLSFGEVTSTLTDYVGGFIPGYGLPGDYTALQQDVSSKKWWAAAWNGFQLVVDSIGTGAYVGAACATVVGCAIAVGTVAAGFGEGVLAQTPQVTEGTQVVSNWLAKPTPAHVDSGSVAFSTLGGIVSVPAGAYAYSGIVPSQIGISLPLMPQAPTGIGANTGK